MCEKGEVGGGHVHGFQKVDDKRNVVFMAVEIMKTHGVPGFFAPQADLLRKAGKRFAELGFKKDGGAAFRGLIQLLDLTFLHDNDKKRPGPEMMAETVVFIEIEFHVSIIVEVGWDAACFFVTSGVF